MKIFCGKNLLLLPLIAASGLVNAATYDLPDPAVTVTISAAFNTTSVTVAGKSYRGTSQFYYVSECPGIVDTYAKHCNILEEDDVVLTAADGSTVTVTIVDQSLTVLIRSGHNYYRHSDTLLSGELTQ